MLKNISDSGKKSKELSLNQQKNKNIKEIYFIIISKGKTEKQNNYIFSNVDYKIENIYSEVCKQDLFVYKKVFKLIINEYDRTNQKEINIIFESGAYKYFILFSIDERMFYYDIEVTKEINFLSMFPKTKQDQNILDNFQKLELFLAALKMNKELEKIENLFEEAIKLYSKKKGFYLLISLFVNIYDQKSLCRKLIEEFNKINKENKNENNMDRRKGLENYISIFSTILSKADEIIKNNTYNPIYFYGIIFSYLNFYDYDNFKKNFQKLYIEKCGVLYEILLIYNTNFLNPINQDSKFFENFIEYTINNKEFNIFENSLNYILYIETFISVIEKKKEEIIKRYNNEFKTIKVKADLKINKKEKGEEIISIIESIKLIIDFSKKSQKLLIYLNSNFWINILKNYNEPNALNIDICFKLRELLKEYHNAIKEIFKEEKKKN